MTSLREQTTLSTTKATLQKASSLKTIPRIKSWSKQISSRTRSTPWWNLSWSLIPSRITRIFSSFRWFMRRWMRSQISVRKLLSCRSSKGSTWRKGGLRWCVRIELCEWCRIRMLMRFRVLSCLRTWLRKFRSLFLGRLSRLRRPRFCLLITFILLSSCFRSWRELRSWLLTWSTMHIEVIKGLLVSCRFQREPKTIL